MKNTVLITGASRGIGRATAHLLAGRGWSVALGCLRHLEEAQTLADELRDTYGADAAVFQADVSDPEAAAAMIADAQRRFGFLSALVNNAGIAAQQLFTDVTPAQWEAMWGVHVSGTVYCCQGVLPAMIREKRGAIVNVSSVWGITGASCEVTYSASKAAVIGLTRALAKEVGPSGIRVNCVAPGVIDTDMLAALDEPQRQALREETPLGRLGTPEDVAAVIAFLLSDEAGFVTGQVLSPNGGFVI